MRILRLLIPLLYLAPPAGASPELDARYAMRKILSAVVNGESESVHAEAVQAELTRLIQDGSRFEWSEEAFEVFTQNRARAPGGGLGGPGQEKLAPWVPFLRAVTEGRAQSVVLSELQRENDTYYLFSTLLVMPEAEILRSVRTEVEDRFALPSFAKAAQVGWQELMRSLPFDATVLSREDYRVVPDRGAPDLRPGMFLPTFTLESQGNGVYLLETGRIQLTRVEKKLAFGKVAVERKPLEVAAGNKIRVAPGNGGGFLVDSEPSPPEKTRLASAFSFAGGNRAPASELSSDVSFRKGNFGSIDVDLAGTFLTWNQSAASGQTYSQSAFYPGAALRGELWLTREFFADFGFAFGMSSFADPSQTPAVSLNTQMSQIRGQVGYRLGLAGSQYGPTVEVRLGLSKSQFQVDTSEDPSAPAGLSYGGPSVGGGLRFPVSSKYLLGLDLNGLLFGSLSETAGTSGDSTSGVSGWDFTFKTAYNLTPNFNLVGKLVFQTNSASFTGQGTRPIALSSTSQSSRAVLLGMSYYF